MSERWPLQGTWALGRDLANQQQGHWSHHWTHMMKSCLKVIFTSTGPCPMSSKGSLIVFGCPLGSICHFHTSYLIKWTKTFRTSDYCADFASLKALFCFFSCCWLDELLACHLMVMIQQCFECRYLIVVPSRLSPNWGMLNKCFCAAVSQCRGRSSCWSLLQWSTFQRSDCHIHQKVPFGLVRAFLTLTSITNCNN